MDTTLSKNSIFSGILDDCRTSLSLSLLHIHIHGLRATVLPLIGQHWLSWLFGYTMGSTLVTMEAPGWCLYPCIPHTDFNCLIKTIFVFSSICSSITLFSSNSIFYTSCFPFLISPSSLSSFCSALLLSPSPLVQSFTVYLSSHFPPLLLFSLCLHFLLHHRPYFPPLSFTGRVISGLQ